MAESIIVKSRLRCKRVGSSKENIRNVRSKSEEKKVKRPGSSFIWFNKHEREKLKNVESENGLRNIRESEIRKLIKEKYNSLSVAEKSTYVDDKKANYRQYKEKLAQGAPKSTICTRMSVIGAYNVIANLTEEQRDSVRSIGLGSLLDLRPFNICTELCSILVSAFNCHNCTLDINGINVVISPGDVSNILGLKDSGIEVSRNVTSTVISGASVHLKLGNLKVELQSMKKADEEFKSKFTLFILGIFLCPVVKAEVDRGLLYIVDDTSKISEMNLANLVFTCLVEGIRERQQTGNKYVRGCLAFLMLFYFEHVKTKFQSSGNRPIPRLSLWDQNAVKEMIGAIKTLDWYKLKEDSTCTIKSHLCKADIHSSAKFMKDEDGIKDESKGGTEFHENIGGSVKPNDQLSSIVERLDRLEKLFKGIGESVTPTDQLSNIVERLDRLEKFIIGVNEDLTNRLDGLVDKAMMRFRNELEASTNKVDNSIHVILQQLQKRNYLGSQTKKPSENQNEDVQDDHDRHRISHNEVERTNIPTRSKKCNMTKSTPQKTMKDIDPTFNIENDVRCKYVSSASNNVQDRGSEVPTVKEIVSPTLKPKSITSSLSATLAQRIRINNRRVSKPGPYEKSPWLVKKPTNKRTKKTMKLNNETNEEDDGLPEKGRHVLTRKNKFVCKRTKGVLAPKIIEYMWDKNPSTLHQVVVDLGVEQADRAAMISLSGTNWVSNEIINLVAIIEKKRRREFDGHKETRVWFLPNYYSQVILEGPELNLNKICDDYLQENTWGGDITLCDKIFVPMNDRNVHWYAFVINFVDQNVIILDSLWTHRYTYNAKRTSDVRKVVHTSHNIFKKKSGYSYQLDHFPIEPANWIPRQVGNNDCGIYVIMFMRNVHNVVKGLEIQFDSVEMRENIVVDLFVNSENTCHDTIMKNI